MYKPFYHNSKSARTAGKQGLGTYKQRSFIIGQNRGNVKLKNPGSCTGKECTAHKKCLVPDMHRVRRNSAERYLEYMQRLEDIKRI